MSWFGAERLTQFKNITGQISNFTKEVLSESTEEIDDHATEIQIARKRIRELEAICSSQKVEIDRLQAQSDDLLEKLQSAEMQFAAMSNEYRTLLNAKEAELYKLQESYHQTVTSSSLQYNDRLHGATYHNQKDAGHFLGDDYDYSAGHELRNEVERLKSECAHWQRVALSKESEETAISSVAYGGRQVEEHQSELLALQQIHAQRLADVRKAHDEETRELRQHISYLETALANQSEGRDHHNESAPSSVVELSDAKSNSNFFIDDELDRIPHKTASTVDATPNHGLGAQQLQGKVADYERQIENYELAHSDWLLEKEALEEMLMRLREQLKEQQIMHSVIEAQREKSKVDEHALPSASAGNGEGLLAVDQAMSERSRPDDRAGKSLSVGSKQHSVDDDDNDIEGAVRHLNDQVNELTEANAQLEGERDIACAEKVQLKEEVTRLRHTVEDLERQLRSVKEDAENTTRDLKQRLAKEFDAQLKGENGKFLQEIDRYKLLLDESNSELHRLNEELRSVSDASHQDRAELQQQLLARDERIAQLIQQLTEVEHGRDVELKQSSQELSELRAANVRHGELEYQLAARDERIAQLVRQLKDIEGRELELNRSLEELSRIRHIGSVQHSELEQQLAAKEDHIARLVRQMRHLEDRDAELNQSLKEVNGEHEKAVQQLLHSMDNEKRQNVELRSEISILNSTLENAILEKDRLGSEISSLRQEVVRLLSTKDSDVGEAHERSTALEQLVKQYEERLAMAEESLTNERDQQNKLIREKEILSQEMYALEQLVRQYEDKIKSADESLKNEKQQKNELIKQRETLSQEIRVLGENNHRLSQETELMSARCKHLADVEQQLVEASLAMDTLNQRVQSLESELESNKIQRKRLHSNKELQTDRDPYCEKDEDESQKGNQNVLDNSRINGSESEFAVNNATDVVSKRESELQNQIDHLQNELLQMGEKMAHVTLRQQEALVSRKDASVEGTVIMQCVSEGTLTEDKYETATSEHDLEQSMATKERHYTQEELDGLRKIVEQKDKVIAEMRESHASLLRMLEEKSLAQCGSRTLVEVHRLDSEVRALRLEKEQMMSILNERTREGSQLKAEVHRLMSVISAERAALAKLQKDNSEIRKEAAGSNLSTMPSSSSSSGGSEMGKEAVKKLSQIIRDKDQEIEALRQRNGTLVQVLQDNSSTGNQMAVMLQERDNLGMQLVIFQTEREQIIAALSAKHQESLAYHAEMQRLQQVLNEEQKRRDELDTEYSMLAQQYEEKKQTLLNVQNELLTCKQKLKEIDGLYKEEVQKKQALVTSGSLKRTSSPASARIRNDVADVGAANNGEHDVAEVIGESDSLLIKQLEEMRAALVSNEEAFFEKDRIIQAKETQVRACEKTLREKDSLLSEKEKVIVQLNAAVHRCEESIRAKDSELAVTKKQCENMTFQLQGYQAELGDLRQEREQLSERYTSMQQEISFVREANNRLSLSINDRDFELKALTEKAATLTQLMSERSGDAEKGETDKLMRETEEMHQQMRALRQDRDQFAAALQQQQGENRELLNQVKKLSESENRLSREVERLRQHLLQMEETYTQEALESESREKALRNRLAAAEEKALSSSSAVQSINQRINQQLESLQAQVKLLTEQRDGAMAQLSSARDANAQYAASLQNLQAVLEQFQREKEIEQAAEVLRCQREVDKVKDELRLHQDRIRQLQLQLDEATETIEAASRLSEQLDRKEEMVRALRDEVQVRESELKKAEEEMRKITNSTEAKVDKALVKNLIVGYFHTQGAKRPEVLQLIAKVLSFNKEEMEQVGLGGHSGSWLGVLFRRPSTQSSAAVSFDKSFSELFVKFLEKESTPEPQLHLPAERMAQEALRGHPSQGHGQGPAAASLNARPAFNPFATPILPGDALLGASLGADPSPRYSAQSSTSLTATPSQLLIPSMQTLAPAPQTSSLFASATVPGSRALPTRGESPSLMPAWPAAVANAPPQAASTAILKDVLQLR